jgi:hypothetical protein
VEAVDFLQSIDGSNIRMIQRCQDTRLALEPRNTFVVTTEGFWKEFDGDTAPELGVGGLINLTIPPDPRCAVIS